MPEVKNVVRNLHPRYTFDEFMVGDRLNRARPVYEEMDGWKTDISDCRTFAALPNNAQKYVRFLEEASRVGPLHVRLSSDALHERRTGRPPRFPAAERLFLASSLRMMMGVGTEKFAAEMAERLRGEPAGVSG